MAGDEAAAPGEGGIPSWGLAAPGCLRGPMSHRNRRKLNALAIETVARAASNISRRSRARSELIGSPLQIRVGIDLGGTGSRSG